MYLKTTRTTVEDRCPFVSLQPQVSAPPYIGMNMAIEGQGLHKPTGNMKRHSEVTSPRVVPVSKTKDNPAEVNGGKPAFRHKEFSPEGGNARITSLSRPKETRNVFVTPSGEALETTDSRRRAEAKKKPEGSWAIGCMCAPQSIPIATTFCTTDDGKLKGLIARSKTRYNADVDVAPDVQQRAPRAMQIPKAVLKYSTDTSMRQQAQLPISIGPDGNGKHF